MWCLHKWGKIEKGYQYCERCGKAQVVACHHMWKEVEKFNVERKYHYTGTRHQSTQYILKCTECGEMTKKEF